MSAGRVSTAFDVFVLATTAIASAWLVSHTDRQLEDALGLASTQWLYDMEVGNKRILEERVARSGRPVLSDRERYARDHPRSPITWTNRLPGVFAAEKAIAKWVQRSMPALAVAGVGGGVVAVRRPGRRRRRWGPGRVSAAIGLVVSSASIAVEFGLRRCDLMKYGWYHDTMDASWATNARTTAVAILAAWLVMAASGRWRYRRDWRERLGLTMGGLWLAALAWLVVLEPLAQL